MYTGQLLVSFVRVMQQLSYTKVAIYSSSYDGMKMDEMDEGT